MNSSKTKDVSVSVICCTYNQIDYITDALKGFLAQKTNFTFEVLINDDGSDDGTTEVVKTYAKRHSDVIRVFTHERNNHGKIGEVGATRYLIENEAKGKYIALCEGDDYWISANKLQRQYDYLEAHPDYSLCLHNAVIANLFYGVAYLTEADDGDRDKSYEQIVLEGGGCKNPTASFFFRRDAYGYWKPGPVGDHFAMLSIALNGKVRWFSEPLSVYRFKAKGSWTNNFLTKTEDQLDDYRERYIEALRWMDVESDGEYSESFSERISYQNTSVALSIYGLRYMDNKISLFELSKSTGLRTVIKYFLLKNCPPMFNRCGRIELIIKSLIQKTFISSSIDSCSLLEPLALFSSDGD